MSYLSQTEQASIFSKCLRFPFRNFLYKFLEPKGTGVSMFQWEYLPDEVVMGVAPWLLVMRIAGVFKGKAVS